MPLGAPVPEASHTGQTVSDVRRCAGALHDAKLHEISPKPCPGEALTVRRTAFAQSARTRLSVRTLPCARPGEQDSIRRERPVVHS